MFFCFYVFCITSSSSSCFFVFFFFFQAEDGIRDLYVTGVQTCALPISEGRSFAGKGNGVSATGQDTGLGGKRLAKGRRGERPGASGRICANPAGLAHG